MAALQIAGPTGRAYTLAERMARYHVPGVAIAVVDDGEIVVGARLRRARRAVGSRGARHHAVPGRVASARRSPPSACSRWSSTATSTSTPM